MNPTDPAKPVFGPSTAVLELAVSGRWRAPETTAALADHAAAQARAEGDASAALLAEGWLIHGLAAVGRGACAVPRAVAAFTDAARSGHRLAEARLRVGLASVARELGDEDSAWALLAPVVEHEISDTELAADAYLEAVRSGLHGPDGVLAAADLAVGYFRRLRGEQVELGLAALDAALANRHRVAGRARAATARGREGLRRLLGDTAAGSDLDPISPHIAAWLNLELTLALFDDGQPDAARRVAEPALAWAGRPAALVPLTRLRLVLAQRTYLPAGEYDAALRAVSWAAGVVGEQSLPALEADCQNLLAEVHERRGALADALAASRRAHQALRTHSVQVELALVLLGRCAGNARAGTERVQVDRVGGFAQPDRLSAPVAVTRAAAPAATAAASGRRSTAEPAAAPKPEGRLASAPSAAVASDGRPVSGASVPSDGRPVSGRLNGHRPDLRAVPANTAAADDRRMPPVESAPKPAAGADAREPVQGASSATVRLPMVARAKANPPAEDSAPARPVPPWPGDFESTADPARRTNGAAHPAEQWSALTDWPDESRPHTRPAFVTRPEATPEHVTPLPDSASVADTFSYRVTSDMVVEPAVGDIFSDLGGNTWNNEIESTGGIGAVRRAGSAGGVNAADLTGGFDHETYSPNLDDDLGTAPGDGTELPTETDELSEFFDSDEDRPLGLVAIDVATPTGPLAGAPARPLLERVAAHVRSQLPPNSRLRLLARDVVLVALPPVEPDVVARWMRSVAGGLSARWPEYAADVPRSAFRVAVGTLVPGRSAQENVADLCARLSGLPLHPSLGVGELSSGGRHVARASSTVAAEPGRPGPEPGGGRRRRADARSSSTDGQSPVRFDGVAPGRSNGLVSGADSNGSGSNGSGSGLNGSAASTGSRSGPKDYASSSFGLADGIAASRSPGAEQGPTDPSYRRGRNFDRSAVARLSQLAMRPPVTAGRPAGPGAVLAGIDGCGSGGTWPAAGPGTSGGLSETDSDTGLEGSAPESPALDATGLDATGLEGAAFEGGAGERAVASSEQPRRKAGPASELSFAELLAGALNAYRDA